MYGGLDQRGAWFYRNIMWQDVNEIGVGVYSVVHWQLLIRSSSEVCESAFISPIGLGGSRLSSGLLLAHLNPLIATLKPQSNGPSYSNTMIGNTGRWWVVCYIWYSEEGTGRGRSPPRSLLAVPNVTAHLSTASVSTSYYSMWHYNCLWSLTGLIQQCDGCRRRSVVLPSVYCPSRGHISKTVQGKGKGEGNVDSYSA